MRKRTFAAVAGVGGGLGVAAAFAAAAVTGEAHGALPPAPTVTLTTPIATATVGVPEPPAPTVPPPTAPVPTSTAPVPLPPPPAPPAIPAPAPATTTITDAARAATGGSPSPGGTTSPGGSSSAAGAPPAATGEGGAAGRGPVPPGRAAPARAERTLRARPVPGRAGARRLVLTLRRPRELTIRFRGPGDTCRVAGTITIQGRRGANVVPLDGRVRGGRLGAGVFRVEVLDTTGTAERRLGRLAVALRYDARGRARVRQVPLVGRTCPDAGTAVPALLVVGERASGSAAPAVEAAPAQTEPEGGAAPAPAGGHGGADGSTEPDRDVGGIAALPYLGPDDVVDGLTAWVLVTLVLLSAGGFLAVAGASALRALRR